MSQLSFCGAAELSSLLQAADVPTQRDVVVCLVSVPLMDRVLSWTGLRDRFHTYPRPHR
jgi:anti-anti-sigma regulatory factor